MIGRLFISLVGLFVLLAIVGFAVLAVWDVPVEQTQIEKKLDNKAFIDKGL